MGRIKSLMVKNAARQLISSDLKFSEDFEYNKRVLGNTLPSKSIRNKVAGYITRLVKMKRLSLTKVVKPRLESISV